MIFLLPSFNEINETANFVIIFKFLNTFSSADGKSNGKHFLDVYK
jgi:hypothetical protein